MSEQIFYQALFLNLKVKDSNRSDAIPYHVMEEEYAAVQVVLSKQISELGCIHPQAYNIGTFCLNVTEAIMNHPLRRGDYC